MVDNKVIEEIFGWIGFVISTYFYISPVVPFIKVVKGEMEYKDLIRITIGILYIFFELLNIEIKGYAAIVFNVLMLASPGEKIFTVIITGK